MSPPALVIDTNWVLDLWVFNDPRASALRLALEERRCTWLGCPPMRDELQRVLGYPAVSKYMLRHQLAPDSVMADFDRWCHLQPAPPRCPHRCRDADDQVFIDLAVAHQATLLSKDALVLSMRGKLAPLGVSVQSTWI